MLVIIFFLLIVAMLIALDLAAIKWGVNSRKADLLKDLEGR